MGASLVEKVGLGSRSRILSKVESRTAMNDFPKPKTLVALRHDKPFNQESLKELNEELCPCGRITYGVYVDREFLDTNDFRHVIRAIANPAAKLTERLAQLEHAVADDPHPDQIDLNGL
jgi:hypothetical protein